MKPDGVIYTMPIHGFFAITDDGKVAFHWTSNDGDTFMDDITHSPLGHLLLLGQHTLETQVVETIKRVGEKS